MAIDLLTACEWDASGQRVHRILRPSWSDVEMAIRRLNGNDVNDLYLHPRAEEPHTYLCIGGGTDSFVVAGALANQVFPTLVASDRPDTPTVRVMVGGQVGDYPANRVFELDEALRAAKSFYETARFASDFGWVNVQD